MHCANTCTYDMGGYVLYCHQTPHRGAYTVTQFYFQCLDDLGKEVGETWFNVTIEKKT